MSKINWQTAFATAGLTITGLIGAVFASYQLLETNYRALYEAMSYKIEIIGTEKDKMVADTERVLVELERLERQGEEICRLSIRNEKNPSDVLRLYCLQQISGHGIGIQGSEANNKSGLGTALHPPNP